MKNYFLTGLAVLLPIAITILVVIFLFNLLTEPFAGIVNDIIPDHFFANAPEKIQHLLSQFTILLLLISFTFLLGLLGRWFFFSEIVYYSEKIVKKIPIISSLYKTTKDVTTTLFSKDQKSFQQVVLAPYPANNTLALGLVTNEDSPAKDGRLSVYIPCTVNPSSGFLIMVNKKELVYLDMKVDDLLKYLISCGVISVPFKVSS